MTNVVGVEGRGERPKEMLRWVPLWQTMTSYGRLQIFVKTFKKEFLIFQFQAFFCTCCYYVRLLEVPLTHMCSHIEATNEIPIHYPTPWGWVKYYWREGGAKVLEYDNCESIPEAADIPCILLYPLDRYAGSNTIHINRWPLNIWKSHKSCPYIPSPFSCWTQHKFDSYEDLRIYFRKGGIAELTESTSSFPHLLID